MRKELITYRLPKSPISEIFRSLRTNIQFRNSKRGLKTILVTSTSPSEGKSWVIANLAVTFAQTGKKVILVDCDLRKGRQFSLFGVSPTPGLSNYLSGINSNGEDSDPNILSYIQQTEVENLYVIPAGNVPPNPSELLVSSQMADCVEELKNIGDLVIFDGTPSCLVTDAVIISRYVDTTMIVSAYKQTKVEDLKKIKKEIENVGGKIAGVVINKSPISQKKYENAYYYGGNSAKKLSTNSNANKVTTDDNDEKKDKDLSYVNQPIKPKIKKEEKEKISTDDMLKEIQSYVDIEKQKKKKEKGDNE